MFNDPILQTKKLGYGLDNRGFTLFLTVQTGSGGASYLGYSGQKVKLTTRHSLVLGTIHTLHLAVQQEFLGSCAKLINRLWRAHEVRGQLILNVHKLTVFKQKRFKTKLNCFHLHNVLLTLD